MMYGIELTREEVTVIVELLESRFYFCCEWNLYLEAQKVSELSTKFRGLIKESENEIPDSYD